MLRISNHSYYARKAGQAVAENGGYEFAFNVMYLVMQNSVSSRSITTAMLVECDRGPSWAG